MTACPGRARRGTRVRVLAVASMASVAVALSGCGQSGPPAATSGVASLTHADCRTSMAGQQRVVTIDRNGYVVDARTYAPVGQGAPADVHLPTATWVLLRVHIQCRHTADYGDGGVWLTPVFDDQTRAHNFERLYGVRVGPFAATPRKPEGSPTDNDEWMAFRIEDGVSLTAVTWFGGDDPTAPRVALSQIPVTAAPTARLFLPIP